MELLILDTNLEAVTILDTFESIIWTDRYFKCGDFEIFTPVNLDALTYLQPDYYIWLKDSGHVMIIEDREINSNVENGASLTVSGRSLESILDRRVIWGQTILSGNLQDGIEQLLNANVISPVVPERQISNFAFQASTEPAITELTIDAQYNGENLYDVVQTLCEANNIGWKITLTDDGLFLFELYSGIDRSYDQVALPYVVFSPKFENLINSNYVESKKALKTVSFVVGEGEGSAQKSTTAEIVAGGGSDLNRREMFTDASDISSTTDEGVLTDPEYLAQLAQRGVEELSEYAVLSSFEGQVDNNRMFKYGEDFFMGDVVQIANEYGLESKSRVIEVVRSQSLSGIEIYPTFSTVE